MPCLLGSRMMVFFCVCVCVVYESMIRFFFACHCRRLCACAKAKATWCRRQPQRHHVMDFSNIDAHTHSDPNTETERTIFILKVDAFRYEPFRRANIVPMTRRCGSRKHFHSATPPFTSSRHLETRRKNGDGNQRENKRDSRRRSTVSFSEPRSCHPPGDGGPIRS